MHSDLSRHLAAARDDEVRRNVNAFRSGRGHERWLTLLGHFRHDEPRHERQAGRS